MQIENLIWTEENFDHVSRHGVTPEEVAEVCLGRSLVTTAGNDRYRVIGQTEGGRLLTIFVAKRNLGFHPITARNSTEKEKKRFRK